MPRFCAAGLLALLTLLPPAQAQEPEEPADAASSAAPAAPVKPMPAEKLPLAPRRLVLDVVNTGAHLVAVGERGHVLVSNNGADWAQVVTPVRSTLTAVSFIDAQQGWAVGHDAAILHTADGGKSWQLQNFEPEKEMPFLDVLFVDAQTGYAVGAYGLMYTTADGGTTWSEIDAPSVRDEEVHFNGIVRLGDGALFVVGETGMLGVSADGRQWQRLASPYEGTMFGALPYRDKGAVIFGLRGNAYVSEDVRSKPWRKLETGTVASFYGGATLADGRVALAGLAGELHIVDPAGGAAQRADSGVTTSQSAVLAWNQLLLLAGESGVRRVALKL